MRADLRAQQLMFIYPFRLIPILSIRFEMLCLCHTIRLVYKWGPRQAILFDIPKKNGFPEIPEELHENQDPVSMWSVEIQYSPFLLVEVFLPRPAWLENLLSRPLRPPSGSWSPAGTDVALSILHGPRSNRTHRYNPRRTEESAVCF